MGITTCSYTCRIRGGSFSVGTSQRFADPESFARHIVNESFAFEDGKPGDVVEVEATVFGRKTRVSRKDTVLCHVVIAEYPWERLRAIQPGK